MRQLGVDMFSTVDGNGGGFRRKKPLVTGYSAGCGPVCRGVPRLRSVRPSGLMAPETGDTSMAVHC